MEASYLATSRWRQCAHCFVLLKDRAEHYCGADFQVAPLGEFPDGVSQEWLDAAKDQVSVRDDQNPRCQCGVRRLKHTLTTTCTMVTFKTPDGRDMWAF